MGEARGRGDCHVQTALLKSALCTECKVEAYSVALSAGLKGMLCIESRFEKCAGLSGTLCTECRAEGCTTYRLQV